MSFLFSYTIDTTKTKEVGFTLVELLIVIGILAVLTAAVIVVLNPTTLLKEARDVQRIQDLASVDTSLVILETLNSSLNLGTASTVYVSIPSNQTNCSDLGLPSIAGWNYACVSEANLQNTDGTGWIPVNFQDATGVVQLSSLPIDPTNTTTTGLYYTYIKGSWELTAALESVKYQQTAANDGGDSNTVYERRSRGIVTTTPSTLITRGDVQGEGGDTTAPVITLVGDSEVTVYLNDTYIDDGATASDDTDGDITANIVTVNPVNTAVQDTYTVTYNVSDAASNAATEVTRTVVVEPYSYARTFENDALVSGALPDANFVKNPNNSISDFSVVTTPVDAAGYAPPNLTRSIRGYSSNGGGVGFYWYLPEARVAGEPTRWSFVTKATNNRDDAILILGSWDESFIGSSYFYAFLHDYATKLEPMRIVDEFLTTSQSTVSVAWVEPRYWVESRFEWDGTTMHAWFKNLQAGITIGPYSFTPSGLSSIGDQDQFYASAYNGLGSSLSFYVAGIWVGDIEADWPTW